MNTQHEKSISATRTRGLIPSQRGTFWRRASAVLLSIAFVGFVAAGELWAQSERATLTGTVVDPTGSVIVGVEISVSSEATNLSVTTTTNESGRFILTSLKPGQYRVSASAPGFKQYVNTGLTLQVNQIARLDIALDVGAQSETITVVAEASLLEAETSNRGAVIDQQKIIELPLNGRDYNQLALLVPGVLVSTPRLSSIGFKGVFNVNGNRAFQNAFLLDGVDNLSYSNSFRGGNTQILQPSIEALQEFKIQTNAYGAEFGRSAGALINAVIKSGSNTIHGSVYEFHRNDNFDASNFFANRNNVNKAFRLRNQFGASLGGPIVKDKTFIFGDFESLRDRAGTVRISSVPQPIWKQGMFTIPISNPYNPTDTGQDFIQPATAQCDDGNGNCWIIPQNLWDPIALNIFATVQDPNTGAPGQIDNNFVSVPNDVVTTDQFDIRVDHVFSDKINLFGRYSFSDTDWFKPAPRPGLNEGSFNDTFGSALWRSQAIAVGTTWYHSSTLLSEIRFGFTRGNFFQTPPNFGSGCPLDLIGLQGAPTDESICGGLPVMDIPGGNLRRIGRTTSVPQFQTPRSIDIREALSWIRGNHSLKFGGEFLHVQTGILDVSTMLGRFAFDGRFVGQNGEYQGGIADLLLGFPSRYRQDSKTVFNMFQRMYFFYGQDDWKVSDRLTLNLGLRYEFATPPRDKNDFAANFISSAQAFVSASGSSLFSRALINPDYNNFAPRIGFAYRPLERTVVRGGYGVFYNHTNRQGREGLLGFNFPFIINGNQRVSGNGLKDPVDTIFRLQDGITPGFLDPNVIDITTVSRKAQDPNQRTTYIQQWNLGIQHEIVTNLLFDIAYVGNKGTKLAAFRNLNQRPVVFDPVTGVPSGGTRPLSGISLNGNIQLLENLGKSSYHSFQLRLDKRFSDGITGLLSYTWGKALTDSVDHLSTSGAGNGVDVGVSRTPQNGFDRGNEYGLAEFDVQQRFVASAVWELPFGGSGTSRALNLLIGGWEFSPIITLQTGLGLTITQSGLLNLGGERNSRPNRIADGTLSSSQQTVDQFFDTSAFVILQTDPTKAGFVPFQTFGDSGIGVLRGPNLRNFDFNLSKTFDITEGQTLQFRAEFFNAFNRANFGVPGVRVGSGFGEIVNTATEARIIQFGLKYKF